MRGVISFGVASLGVIAIALLAFWAMGGFRGLGLDTAGSVALALGVLFTSALAAALMALVFYSDRSNTDEDAYRAADGADDSQPTDRRENDGITNDRTGSSGRSRE
jgi:hypothetical protein